MSQLRVHDLWKSYDGRPVLRGLDLVVEPGALTAVLGPSGCGKTTLLRVIAGFERAEQGEVVLGGTTLEDEHVNLAPEKRGIGYVPQEGALFPHLSVEGNVGFGLSRRERRGAVVRELLEMVGIAGLARRLPHELSGGEQQRVALARALARKPQVLLLDEPFSSLDASLRGIVREEVNQLLREQGATTVLVTHDQEEALSLADSVAVLRDGRIVQHAAPNELYEAPVDHELATFLGAVNVVDAEIQGETARTALGTLTLRGGHDAAILTSATRVMVRPEQLDIHPRTTTGGGGGPQGVEGRVEECRYYGHDALLKIRPDDPALALLLARVHGELALPAGAEVTVGAHGPVSVV
ncbi:MAG TPA: ABC transporter ATP-binding protein [Solirubrobacteraceae bacterium]|nr:ABC transporter ATP-binding protein [Solirubrobacteraceae bacterium]